MTSYLGYVTNRCKGKKCGEPCGSWKKCKGERDDEANCEMERCNAEEICEPVFGIPKNCKDGKLRYLEE